ncbi:hypothetical protein ILYODFUR_018825 [Ilyodon furcidens]|uniref:Uncharacterized protein n=1 Tax=Ilyodon furcidens TaxID=33524 RepID=A0ABV0T965_9TELE
MQQRAPKAKAVRKAHNVQMCPHHPPKNKAPYESAPLRKEDPQHQTQEHIADTHTPTQGSHVRKSTLKPTKGRAPTEPIPKHSEKPRPLHPGNNSGQSARPNHADPSDPSSRQN